MRVRMHSRGLAAILCCAGFGGCHLVFGFDYTAEETGGQGGGTSQSGGGTTTTASMGGTGGTTTTGGGGGDTTTTSADPCVDDVMNGNETDIDCGGGVCVQCGLGNKCVVATDCQNGHCIDGVCCDNQCTGSCDACSVEKGGSIDGTCTPVKLGTSAEGDCPAGSTCDGQGTCKLDKGQICASAAECASGSCVDGYCCDIACSGSCESCALAGNEGTCTKISAGTDPDNECSGAAPDDACNGAGACGLGPLGGTCVAGMGSACQSTFCVDGYCCENVCGPEKCLACRSDFTGFSNGLCKAVIIGEDPEHECVAPEVCLGNGVCGPPP